MRETHHGHRPLALPVLLAIVLLAACASDPLGGPPASRPSSEIVQTPRPLITGSVRGAPFTHRTLARGLYPRADSLHIYLGGDGVPWVAGRYPARDPTDDADPVFHLLKIDPGPAVFVGRPCYHGYAADPQCRPELWTRARYGAEVLLSMRAAVEALIEEWQPRQVVLVGYSGGGVIALGLAPLLSAPAFTITVAGNLDVLAWQRWHGYLPLDDSLNPAAHGAYYAPLPQLHLQGGRDRVVPVATTARYLAQLPGHAVRRYTDADHSCCWEAVWAAILEEAPWEKEG